MRISSDKLDQELENALREIREFFDVDGCALQHVFKQKGVFKITHASFSEGTTPPPVRVEIPLSYFPWTAKKVLDDRIASVVESMSALPPEAATDRQTWTQWGVKSALDIPVFLGTDVGYLISFGSTRRETTWHSEYIPRLRLLGEVFVSALERRRKEDEMRDMLEVERAMAALSVRLLNCPADDFEGEIRKRLLPSVACPGADESILVELSQDGTEIADMISQVADGISPFSGFSSIEEVPYRKEILNGDAVMIVTRIVDVLPEYKKQSESLAASGIKSFAILPLKVGGKAVGFNLLASHTAEQLHQEISPPRLQLLSDVLAGALFRKRMEGALRAKLQSSEYQKRQLENENIVLRSEAELLGEQKEIIGHSQALKEAISKACQVARTDSTVLLQGETGTGKELFAQLIHSQSRRRNRLMVRVNCAALSPTLIESELFGRERGAYTGAMTKQIGRFELADNSTLLLDEISELPLDLQAKLLRVLESGEFERLGSPRSIRVNVRVIAASNRDMEQVVREGKFREDLLYRLKVFPISIPPLRERAEDIPVLARAFLAEFSSKLRKNIRLIPRNTLDAMKQYHWPGNIRELRNVIEQGVIITEGEMLEAIIPQKHKATPAGNLTLQETEYERILEVLEGSGWRIKGKGGAAEALGLKPSTLYSKMEKLGISKIHS